MNIFASLNFYCTIVIHWPTLARGHSPLSHCFSDTLGSLFIASLLTACYICMTTFFAVTPAFTHAVMTNRPFRHSAAQAVGKTLRDSEQSQVDTVHYFWLVQLPVKTARSRHKTVFRHYLCINLNFHAGMLVFLLTVHLVTDQLKLMTCDPESLCGRQVASPHVWES